MARRISGVSRFSTGTVDIHPQHAYRGRSPMYWWILTSRRWLTGRPINVYVIEHGDGIVLFDTGQDRASVTDPGYFPDGPTGLIYRRLARFHVSEGETLTAGLARLGYRPADVSTAVISHLHQDHIGGVREIPNAELLCRPRSGNPSIGRWPSHGACSGTTSTCPVCDGHPWSSPHSRTHRWRLSPPDATCSATVHSSSSRPRDTPAARCRCWSAAPRPCRSCSPAISPMTSTRSKAAEPEVSE